MSLKAFHLIFVTVVLAFLVGLGVFSLRQYQGTGQAAWLSMAIIAVALVPVLLVYGVWFLRKLRHISYL